MISWNYPPKAGCWENSTTRIMTQFWDRESQAKTFKLWLASWVGGRMKWWTESSLGKVLFSDVHPLKTLVQPGFWGTACSNYPACRAAGITEGHCCPNAKSLNCMAFMATRPDPPSDPSGNSHPYDQSLWKPLSIPSGRAIKPLLLPGGDRLTSQYAGWWVCFQAGLSLNRDFKNLLETNITIMGMIRGPTQGILASLERGFGRRIPWHSHDNIDWM